MIVKCALQFYLVPVFVGVVGVYGAIPQSTLDEGEDLLKHLLYTSPDLVDLKRISENAQKQYVRSRNQPAPESIKRAKQLPVPLPLHPLFSGTEVLQQHQLLDTLRHYKPTQVYPSHHSGVSFIPLRCVVTQVCRSHTSSQVCYLVFPDNF